MPINSYTVSLCPAIHTAVRDPRGFARQTQVPGGTASCARPARGPQSPCLCLLPPRPPSSGAGAAPCQRGIGLGVPGVRAQVLATVWLWGDAAVDGRRGLSTHWSVVPPSKGRMAIQQRWTCRHCAWGQGPSRGTRNAHRRSREASCSQRHRGDVGARGCRPAGREAFMSMEVPERGEGDGCTMLCTC